MTNMTSFAKRMMRINQRGTTQNVPTAIFRNLASLSEDITGRPAYRIGLWPCISEDAPLQAMGLWTAFAYLLERWRDIEVYRLFTTFEEDQDDLPIWEISQMQFAVEDWEVEALDENIGIWGEYKAVDTGIELRVFIENDLVTGQDNETLEIAIQAADLTGMIQLLPKLSEQVAEAIEASLLDETLPTFTQNSVNQTNMEHLFEHVLQWETRLLGHLWNIEWEDTDIISAYDTQINAGKNALEQGNFSAWLVAQCVAQTMRPGYSVIGDLLVEHIGKLYAAFADTSNAIPLVAEAIFTMGQAQQAYNLLEDHTNDVPKNAASW
ncbi:MAG: hypothetical protein KC496_12760, partial [Anaerolineae bacterium]|nr:hypothetical protein [Anaerolineae bacterium]